MFQPLIPNDRLLYTLNTALLMSSFYLFFLILTTFLDWASGIPFSVGHLLIPSMYNFWTSIGCVSIIGHVLAAVINSIFACIIVIKPVRPWKWMLAIALFHFLVVSIYSRFNLSFAWLVSFVAACSGAVFVAEIAAIRLETVTLL